MIIEPNDTSEKIIKQVWLTTDKSCYCWRCGYEWTSRKKSVPPAICPRCKSDMWHTHRRFECQDCGHIFDTGDLFTPAYQLFPNCPSCRNITWHKGRQKELNDYLQQVKSARPGYILISLWILFIFVFLLSLVIGFGPNVSTETLVFGLKPQEFRPAALCYLGLVILFYFIIRSAKNRKLNDLIVKKKINPQEADWIKGQLKPSHKAS